MSLRLKEQRKVICVKGKIMEKVNVAQHDKYKNKILIKGSAEIKTWKFITV